MYWYVLFVRTGREYMAEQFLKNRLDTNLFMPFIPMLETLFKISGQIRKEIRPLFPGYIFVESAIPSIEFMKKMSRVISTRKEVIRILRYGDSNEIALREDEKNMLLSLCNDDYCIESSRGIMVGDRVYIKEGSLMGKESIIRKINRHKKRAIIEMNFMGDIRQVSVALEIVEKI